jgi:heat shock protein HslJ
MACFAALMDQERLFLEVLTQIARCTFGEDGKLVLLSRDARVIVARRAPS